MRAPLPYHASALHVHSDTMSDKFSAEYQMLPLGAVFVLQGAASGVRVNSVSPGHVETPIYGDMPLEMLTNVTKTTQLIGRPIQSDEVIFEPLHIGSRIVLNIERERGSLQYRLTTIITVSDMMSQSMIFDTSKLLLSICTVTTRMPGVGGQNTLDTTQRTCRYFKAPKPTPSLWCC